MENLTEPQTDQYFRIDPATLPGYVHLTVRNLEQQIEFYQKALGMRLHWASGNSAGLGAGQADLVHLTQSPDGKRYPGTTGMYHFAILYPDRRELARIIARLYALRWPNYPTDHVMTKTTYLDDPEGNNIELYAESPEDGTWSLKSGDYVTVRKDGSLSGGRDPLDLDALFSHLRPDEPIDLPMPEETRIGHFHLYVSDLPESIRFYHDVLGFDDMGHARRFRMGMVSAGGYHHHIGLNTWMGEGAPAAPQGALGLRYLTFTLPNPGALDELAEHVHLAGFETGAAENGFEIKDPSQNRIVFTSR
jgi:catechol 2,3-dioxygenase